MALTAERILSIQSHVVYGYVGGKAAVFPLQCLGYDVDVVNTVHFSNHAGYGRLGGTKTTATEINNIFESLKKNEFLTQTRLLTGYVPGAEALSAVAGLARQLKQEKPDLIYLLDPVMGDGGLLYVSPDVVPIYREMLPLATIIAPNWFEVETLTQVSLNDLASLQRALKILHEEYHVPNVVITSIPLKPWLFNALPSLIQPPADSDNLLCIASSTIGSSVSKVHAHCVPLLPGYFSGVGDLFSALLLAHFHPNAQLGSSDESPVSYAASQALSKTHAVLRATYEYSETLPEEDRLVTDDEQDAIEPLRKTRRMKGRELRLVQSQDIIRGISLQNIVQLQPWRAFWDQP